MCRKSKRDEGRGTRDEKKRPSSERSGLPSSIGHPPCGSCEYGPHTMPAIMPENLEVIELWQDVSTQWRGAGMGIVGLDYGEVRIRAKELDIELSECVWSKVRMLERVELKMQNQKED